MDSSKFTLHLIHHTVNSNNSPDDNGGQQAAATSPNNNDDEQFEQKLFDLTEQLNFSGYNQPNIFCNLVVESAVVSGQHLAFLLDNGRVCRVGYQYNGANLNNNNEAITQTKASAMSLRSN